jgi:tetratricopeptide (TPR) repeat protein
MIYVADMCLFLGLDADAERQYKAILDRYNSDEEFKKTAAKAIARVYAQSVTVLRRKGDEFLKAAEAERQKAEQVRKTGKLDEADAMEAKIPKIHEQAREAYEEARRAADSLIEQHPNSLEPRMEKARIIQRIAEQNPASYDEASGEWSMLRTILQGMRKKPPEYYEATYNLGACLIKQGDILKAGASDQQAEAEKKFRDAQKLLKSTLIMAPQLNGPDMVAKFEALLKEIADRLPPIPENSAPPTTTNAPQ